MGTIVAIITIIVALVLTSVGFGLHFWLMAAMVVLLWLSVFLRPRADIFLASAFFAGFVGLMISPFAAPRAFLTPFRREARGEGVEAEAAQATIDFYEFLASFVVPLEIAFVIIILAAIVLAARRDRRGAHEFLLAASEGIGEFTVRVGKVASVLFIPMIFLIIYDVAQRQYLDVNPAFTNTEIYKIFTSTRLQEAQWHLHAALFLLCFGYAYVKDAHVRIELVRDRMAPRTRVWIELLGCCLFLIPYCFVIFTYGYEFAYRSWATGEISAAQTGLSHRFVIKSFLPIGFTLLALAGLSVALKCIVYLFGPNHLNTRAGYYAGTHHADIPEDVLHDDAEARPTN